jgi:hypothetical protein
MFEGSKEGKFPLMSMGCRVEGIVCADPEARTPISVSGILFLLSLIFPEGIVVGF